MTLLAHFYSHLFSSKKDKSFEITISQVVLTHIFITDMTLLTHFYPHLFSSKKDRSFEITISGGPDPPFHHYLTGGPGPPFHHRHDLTCTFLPSFIFLQKR